MAKAKAKKKGKKKGRHARMSKGKKARKGAKSKGRKGAAKKSKAAAKKSTAKKISYPEPAPSMATDTSPEVTTFATDMTSHEEPSPLESTPSEETSYGEYGGSDDSSRSSSM
jgi:hypothetical protein